MKTTTQSRIYKRTLANFSATNGFPTFTEERVSVAIRLALGESKSLLEENTALRKALAQANQKLIDIRKIVSVPCQ